MVRDLRRAVTRSKESVIDTRIVMGGRRNRRDVVQMLVSASAASFVSSQGFNSAHAEPSAAVVTRQVIEDVRERISQGIARGESTGVALAVVSGNRIVWEEGFGWADRMTDVKITPHSAFSLESVTKVFTATLITALAAEGKLDLDQPANQYLGPAKIRGTNGNAEEATVRRLGAHASGLPGTFEALYGGVQSPSPDIFLEKFGRLAFPPGQIWEYSNVGFEALGGIAKNLTGKDFGVLMKSLVLAPLGLSDSFWDTDSRRIAQGVPRYDQTGKKLPFHLTTTPPSGELLASAHDLARFAMWNMKMPLSGGAQLLSEHWIDELHKPVFVGPTGATSTFGWARDRLSSGETVFHKAGGGPGASTLVCFIPERRLACVVLNNHSTGVLTNAVCDRILGSFLPTWKTPEENGEPPRTPFVIDASTAGLWRGTLMNDDINLPVELNVISNEAVTLRLGSSDTQHLAELRAEGRALLGKTGGTIHSPDATASPDRSLALKLVRSEGKLVGRISAMDQTLSHERNVPYVLNLSWAARG